MRLKTSAKSLAAALAATSKLDTKSLLIDGCVRLRASRGQLEVSGSSILDHYTETIGAEIETPGIAVVSGAHLRDALRGLSSDVALVAEDGDLTVSHGRGSADMQTRLADDWPPIDEPQLGAALAVEGEALATALRQIAHSICRDETRPHLCGIAILESGDLAVSNGATMAMADLGVQPPEYLIGTILPASAVASILSMADAGGQIAIARDGGGGRYVAITSNGRELRTAAPGRSPPPYRRILDSITGAHTIDADRAQLLESVVRIGAALGDACVRLSADGERLHMSAQNPHVGSMAESVDATGGDGAEVGLGARYLRESLAAGDGERVIIRMDDSLSPIAIVYPDCPGLIHVIMPRRA
jgi:DNA polymerase III sliding clamp (beta) subunit (PCNA family)